MFKERLEALIDEMTERGIFYSEAVREFRKIFIGRALEHNGGNQVKTAQKLGMHRNTLKRHMSELGIVVRAPRKKRGLVRTQPQPARKAG
jgi:Fis family transcriptional regulator, factor for inversion stimulation protein